jgi:protein-disulfide isomerase
MLSQLKSVVSRACKIMMAGMFAAAVCGIGAATAQTKFNPAQKSEIEKIVKDYLIKNPAVLREALIALQKYNKDQEEIERKQALTSMAPQLLHSKYQVVLGNPKGKIQLVEFFDYNCGYCRRAIDDLGKLIAKNPDLRVVLKEFPVLGPASQQAAVVASALHQQFDGAKYWNFHQRLMNTRGRVGKAQALAAARASGADMVRLDKDMKSNDVSKGIREVRTMADALNMNGTPSYVVGSDVVIGAVGYDKLQARINNLRKCGKSSCD